MAETINILGSEYKIIVKKYGEDEAFEKVAGYCSNFSKDIVLCEVKTQPDWKKESIEVCNAYERETLRHEIVHAFLNESGLCANSTSCGAWATNEEMIDWIAKQGEKIYKAWQEAECL